MVAICSTAGLLGLPQPARADSVTVEVNAGETATDAIVAAEAEVNALLAEVNPLLGTLAGELTTVESDLTPYETEEGLSPATLGALVALGLIEAGGTLPDTCSDIASIEKDIPTSVLGIPISIAEIIGLTPIQVQLVTNYVDTVLQNEEQLAIKELAPAALSLLQVNYDTTYYPPSGSPIVRTTQGYIGLPTLLDVDGNPGLDMCADTEINIGSLTSLISTGKLPPVSSLTSLNTTTLLAELGSLAAISPSSLEIQQQIAKLPLAATTLPVDVNADLPNLGNLGFGYSTKGSSAPLGYATTIQIGSSPLLSMTDTTTDPGPSLTQTVSLGTTGNLDYTWSPVPSSMQTGFGLTTPSGDLLGLQFPNYVSSPSDWTFSTALGATATSPGTVISANDNELQPPSAASSSSESETVLGIPLVGIDASYSNGFAPSKSFSGSIALPPSGTAPPEVLSVGVNPLPTSFDSCSAILSIACSNVNTSRNLTGSAAQTALTSMHFTSSSLATTTQSVAAPTPTVTALSSTSGPSIGGASETITGTGFAVNPGGTIFHFGSNVAGNVVCAKTTSCTATVPGGAVGSVPVTATVDGVTTPAATAAAYSYTASAGTPVTFAAPTPTCGEIPDNYAQVTGTDVYADTNLSSDIWLDTGGAPVSGCSVGVDLGSFYPVVTGTTPPVSAGGGSPTGRLGVFSALGLTANSLTKTGTMVCPTGTDIDVSGLNLSDLLCPTPPAFTSGKYPVVSPATTAYYGSAVTVNNGTITPTNMAADYTYQWQLCAPGAPAGACPAVSPADTTNSYSIPIPTGSSSEVGDTLQAAVTATNSDGAATVLSARSVAVSAPPPPVNTVAPVVSDTSRSGAYGTAGDVLTTTNGTWKNGTIGFYYEWFSCTVPGNVCTQVGGTTNSYTVMPSDEGSTIESAVQAYNVNVTPSAYVTSSNQIIVPTAPTNSVVPNIIDAGSDATGQSVLQGDNLSLNTGTWGPANGNDKFTYVWEDCTGSTCTPIPGATSSSYTTTTSDIGSTIEAEVTATNVSGSLQETTAATGLVQVNSLAFHASSIVADGTVNASAPGTSDGTEYIGGTFDTVGPAVGGGGQIPTSSTTGKAVQEAAQVTGGVVSAVAPDGSNGYYIGGTFTAVQGVACPFIAHIFSTGSLDPAFCSTGLVGQVNALDYLNGLVAVGGKFTDGTSSNLVFFNSTATMFASGGDPNGPVDALTDDGNFFFAGGAFTSLATATPTAVGNLAKYAVTSSPTVIAPVPWLATVSNCATAGSAPGSCVAASSPAAVYSLTTVKDVAAFAASLKDPTEILYWVLVGGSFNTASGSATTGAAHANAAAFYGATACTTNVTANNTPAASVTPVSCASAAAGTATLGTWAPNPNGPVDSITSGGLIGSNTLVASDMGTPVYLGGAFTTIALTASTTEAVTGLGEFAISGTGANGAATTTAPAAVGYPYTVAWSPVPGATAPSTSWIPALSAPSGPAQVSALMRGANGNIYAGGNFTSVNGSTYHRIEQFLPSTSATSPASVASTTWDPNAGNTVTALAQDSSNIYVGGSFVVLGGTTRINAAQIDGPDVASPAVPDTVTSWNPSVTGGPVTAVAVSAGVVYLGGSFTQVGGTSRSGLAAVDATSAAVESWNPLLSGSVNALLVNGTNVFVGGLFTSIGGSSAGNLADVSTTSAAPVWTDTTNGVVNALATNSTDLYVGGSFSVVQGQGALSLAAVSPSTGAINTTWAPSAETAASTPGTVDALTVQGGTVYIGGNFAQIDGGPTANLGAVDTVAGFQFSWNPGVDGPVNAIVATNSTVFVGGAFANVDGTPRANVASLSGSGSPTITVSGFDVNPNGPVLALSRLNDPDGTLVLGGAFSSFGSQLTGGFAIF